MKIEMRDPADLRLHSLRRSTCAAALAEKTESAEWNAFVDGISGAGMEAIPPVVITADGRIMDGVRRHQAARQLAWREIACVVRPEEDCAVLMVESLIGQRNLQRCVKVYIAICVLKEFVESAEHRRLSNLKKGVKTLEKPLSSNSTKPDSVRALAEKFGVGKDTVARAIQVHGLFSKDEDIRREWEPKLLAGEKNLWNVLSAVGGAGADQSTRKGGVEASQLEFWENPWNGLKQAAPAWARLDEDKREAVLREWRKTAAKLPQDLRSGMREVLDELEGDK